MKKILLITALAVFGAVWAMADPAVDGTITAGEYAQTKSVLNGTGTLNWSVDAQGGLSVGLSVKTMGWAGVGFGSEKMDGAYIYFGFVGDDGKPVFSEQSGKGHRHADSGKVTADKSIVTQVGDSTTLEFHVAADKLPFTGKTVPFIVASGEKADLKSYHGGSRETGSITLN